MSLLHLLFLSLVITMGGCAAEKPKEHSPAKEQPQPTHYDDPYKLAYGFQYETTTNTISLALDFFSVSHGRNRMDLTRVEVCELALTASFSVEFRGSLEFDAKYNEPPTDPVPGYTFDEFGLPNEFNGKFTRGTSAITAYTGDTYQVYTLYLFEGEEFILSAEQLLPDNCEGY